MVLWTGCGEVDGLWITAVEVESETVGFSTPLYRPLSMRERQSPHPVPGPPGGQETLSAVRGCDLTASEPSRVRGSVQGISGPQRGSQGLSASEGENEELQDDIDDDQHDVAQREEDDRPDQDHGEDGCQDGGEVLDHFAFAFRFRFVALDVDFASIFRCHSRSSALGSGKIL